MKLFIGTHPGLRALFVLSFCLMCIIGAPVCFLLYWQHRFTRACEETVKHGGAHRPLRDGIGSSIVYFPPTFTDEDLQQVAPYLHGFGAVYLELNDTQVTDDGLKVISGLPCVHSVNTRGSKVTKAGLDELRKARPDLQLD